MTDSPAPADPDQPGTGGATPLPRKRRRLWFRVLVPVAALVYALVLRSTKPAKYETAGRFINEGQV